MIVNTLRPEEFAAFIDEEHDRRKEMEIEKKELKVLVVPEIATILKKSKQYSDKFLSLRYNCKFSCKRPFSHAPYKVQASKWNCRKRQIQKNSRRTERWNDPDGRRNCRFEREAKRTRQEDYRIRWE